MPLLDLPVPVPYSVRAFAMRAEDPSKVMPLADEKSGHWRNAASTSSKRLIAQNRGRALR
jgi:hypothetical protein